jgi:hypothetical protein
LPANPDSAFKKQQQQQQQQQQLSLLSQASRGRQIVHSKNKTEKKSGLNMT